MTKVLLFDFDGTIADSFDNFLKITDTLADKYHLPKLSRSELEKLRSEDARTLIKKLKIPFYKIPLLAADMKRMQREHISDLKSFVDLPDTLRTLKNSGFDLGILTSNAKENVELFLQNNNLDIFDYLTSDSSLFGKHTKIRKFMNEYHVAREDLMYVGDEIRDIEACKKVGIKIAAVSWGFTTKEGLMKHNPDFLIDIPGELLEIIKKSWT